jgi:hypothetical protein
MIRKYIHAPIYGIVFVIGQFIGGVTMFNSIMGGLAWMCLIGAITCLIRHIRKAPME